MKKAIILFGHSDWKKKELFSDEKYKKAYEHMYELARGKGLEMYRSSYDWYDPKKCFFKYAWTFRDGKWKRVKKIKPDVVYDKAKSSIDAYFKKNIIRNDFVLINNPEFTHFVNNKFLASLIFPEYFKKYYKVDNRDDLMEIKEKISSSKVVLKPIKGSGGEGVEVLDKKELDKFEFDGTLIAQEFVDSSGGIDGIVKGTHDLRLVLVNDYLIYSYVRTPAEGSLLANVSRGGKMKIVEEKELPKSVLEIIDCARDKFSFYNPKIYTIDLIFDQEQRPWIVEFNTMPGIYFSEGQEKWRDKFYNSIIETIINAAKTDEKN